MFRVGQANWNRNPLFPVQRLRQHSYGRKEAFRFRRQSLLNAACLRYPGIEIKDDVKELLGEYKELAMSLLDQRNIDHARGRSRVK